MPSRNNKSDKTIEVSPQSSLPGSAAWVQTGVSQNLGRYAGRPRITGRANSRPAPAARRRSAPGARGQAGHEVIEAPISPTGQPRIVAVDGQRVAQAIGSPSAARSRTSDGYPAHRRRRARGQAARTASKPATSTAGSADRRVTPAATAQATTASPIDVELGGVEMAVRVDPVHGGDRANRPAVRRGGRWTTARLLPMPGSRRRCHDARDKRFQRLQIAGTTIDRAARERNARRIARLRRAGANRSTSATATTEDAAAALRLGFKILKGRGLRCRPRSR